MANIKELKKKIKSTKNTFKITKAMKLVSAAKLARAQGKIVGFKPYALELEQTVKSVSALNKNYCSPYFAENIDNNKSVVLLISSDKGLCGGYNSILAKTVRRFIKETTSEDLKFYFIGKKVRDVLSKEVNAGETFKFIKLEPDLNEIRAVASNLANMFISGEVGKVYIAYNSFQSAIAFNSSVKQVLPMTVAPDEKQMLQQEYPYDYKYEPSPDDILDTLVPEVFVTTVYAAILDAIASEHGARMTAMENASKNCKEMIKKLTLKMNKMRQAKITTELIEVVSGAESLNG